MGEQESSAGQRGGVVNAGKRGCRSGSLRLSSPGGFRSQFSPWYISPFSRPLLQAGHGDQTGHLLPLLTWEHC